MSNPNVGTVVNDQNNIRLRDLIAGSGLSQAQALERFNEGLLKAYSLSAWKAFLADPTSVRWRRVDDRLIAHATQVLAPQSEPREQPGQGTK